MRTGAARCWLAAAGAAVLVLVMGCSAAAGGSSAGGKTVTPGQPRSRGPSHATTVTPGQPRSPGPSHTAATVPMTLVIHGRATGETVPVYVNGKGPYSFLLDTGSTISSVSQALAAALHLKQAGSTTKVRGVTGSSRAPQATLSDWTVGKVRLRPEKVSELDLSQTSGGVAGLLGSDELRQFGTVTIDFGARQLRLGPR